MYGFMVKHKPPAVHLPYIYACFWQYRPLIHNNPDQYIQIFYPWGPYTNAQTIHIITGYFDLTYALLLPVEHSPQTTRLHPALSCTATSIFLQLYLYSAVHISFSRSLLQLFLGRPLPLWSCGVHCSTCLVMLSSFLLNVCPSQFHFLLCIWSSTGYWPVFPHNSLLAMMLQWDTNTVYP